MLASWLSLIGLGLDIAGFLVLGRELWKQGAERLKWSGNAFPDRLGIILVVLGFIGQAAGQLTALLQSK